ncbi:730_t:CDS:2 [Entrophospora sp. SA101]|nr:730_t:CDS:2 [Entrophospora sp. SA101]CAJ0838237.1 10081_t:CDS:2 [Entrophospora sp. SA101]CAJ0892076.1 16935_t:CDS:2 [Entrophospora sp. SA101]
MSRHESISPWIRNIFSNAAPNIQINGSDFDPENQEYSDTESFNDNLFQNVQSFQAQVENKILNIVERRKNIPGNSDNLSVPKNLAKLVHAEDKMFLE